MVDVMVDVREKQNEIEERLAKLSLYDFIMESFNIVLCPKYYAERNDCAELSESTLREVVLDALHTEFDPSPSEVKENEKFGLYWPELSAAETEAEKKLKKASSYIKGLYEVLKLRLSLFIILKEEDKRRVVRLLSSTEEAKKFGGLRSLHFNKYQTEALMSVANDIGEYLSEKYFHDEEKAFPERQIKDFLETATDKEIERIIYLLNSADEKMIHGGLRSLMLSKPQCEACKEEGIDIVINMVSEEKIKRQNSIKLADYEASKKQIAAIEHFLLEAGFKKDEADRMVRCTNAYLTCEKILKELPKELMAAS